MKKLSLLLIVLFVMAGFLLAACSGGTSADLTGTWKLVSYGSSASPTPAAPNTNPFITFGTDGKLNGNSGCNSFGGDYKTSGDKITFGPIMSTLMGCMDPIGQQESATFQVINNSASFKVDGNKLTITSDDGSSVLTYTRK